MIQELVGASHRVTGQVRSDEKAAPLAATGAQALRATLDDLDALHEAAAAADAVIHTAFNHDFARFVARNRTGWQLRRSAAPWREPIARFW